MRFAWNSYGVHNYFGNLILKPGDAEKINQLMSKNLLLESKR